LLSAVLLLGATAAVRQDISHQMISNPLSDRSTTIRPVALLMPPRFKVGQRFREVKSPKTRPLYAVDATAVESAASVAASSPAALEAMRALFDGYGGNNGAAAASAEIFNPANNAFFLAFALVGTRLSQQKYGKSKEEYDEMLLAKGVIRDKPPKVTPSWFGGDDEDDDDIDIFGDRVASPQRKRTEQQRKPRAPPSRRLPPPTATTTSGTRRPPQQKIDYDDDDGFY